MTKLRNNLMAQRRPGPHQYCTLLMQNIRVLSHIHPPLCVSRCSCNCWTTVVCFRPLLFVFLTLLCWVKQMPTWHIWAVLVGSGKKGSYFKNNVTDIGTSPSDILIRYSLLYSVRWLVVDFILSYVNRCASRECTLEVQNIGYKLRRREWTLFFLFTRLNIFSLFCTHNFPNHSLMC